MGKNAVLPMMERYILAGVRDTRSHQLKEMHDVPSSSDGTVLLD